MFSLISCLHFWTMIWRLNRATKESWPLAREPFKHQSPSTCPRKRTRFSFHVLRFFYFFNFSLQSSELVNHGEPKQNIHLIGSCRIMSQIYHGSRSECPMFLLDLIKDSSAADLCGKILLAIFHQLCLLLIYLFFLLIGRSSPCLMRSSHLRSKQHWCGNFCAAFQ